MSIIFKKICLIGDYGVGKTSLMRRFVDCQFSDQYLSTIGVKISRKLVRVANPRASESQEVQLLIWDVEGQTKYQSIDRSYLRGSSGAIIVADLSRPDTIERLNQHLDLVSSVNPKGIKAIAALNKSDLLSPEQLAAFERDYRFSYSTTVESTEERQLSREPSSLEEHKIQSEKVSSVAAFSGMRDEAYSPPRQSLPTTTLERDGADLPIYLTSAKTGKNVDKIFQQLACLTLNKP